MIKFMKPSTGDREEKVVKTISTITSALLRLEKDIEDFDYPKNVKVEFPNEKDKGNFLIIITPTSDSLWFGGVYAFSCEIPNDYPHEAPKLQCKNKVRKR